MKKSLIIICVAILFLGASAFAQNKKAVKKICITFDDLPVVRVHDHIERMMITDEIIYALDEFKVKAAGFVVGDNIEGHFDLIEKWLKAGHTIGNHTFSHPDLNELPVDFYISDMQKGHDIIEDMLKKYKQKERYFRYPYLHYGGRPEVKKEVAEFLSNHKYRIAHVSIDTDDFAYNLQYEKIQDKSDSLEISRLGNEYFDHLMEQIESAEKLAKKINGKPIKHILLLHANRLNSFFLYDLLKELQSKGFKFISLKDALSDPVYSKSEGYVGPKGISYLERLDQSDPDMIPAQE